MGLLYSHSQPSIGIKLPRGAWKALLPLCKGKGPRAWAQSSAASMKRLEDGCTGLVKGIWSALGGALYLHFICHLQIFPFSGWSQILGENLWEGSWNKLICCCIWSWDHEWFPSSSFSITLLHPPSLKLWFVLPQCTWLVFIWGVWVPGYHVSLSHTMEVLRDAPVGFLSAKHSPACSHYIAATSAYTKWPLSHLSWCCTSPEF